MNPTDSADEVNQPERSANDGQRPLPPLPPLRALEPLPFDPLKRFYDMDGKKLMLVFNHTKYEKSMNYRKYEAGVLPREFTDRDVRRLQEVFGNEFEFDIEVYTDKKKDDIYDIVNKLSQQDHSNTSCVCVVVMTHGDKNGELFASNETYDLGELVRILQLGNLAGKPKLFIVQACRGAGIDKGIQFDSIEESTKISTHADTLVFRSSVEGYVSWMGTHGSWFIQELCRVVHFTQLDFLQMTTMVTSLIVTERASYTKDPHENDAKQTPEVWSTLTKLLRFERPLCSGQFLDQSA